MIPSGELVDCTLGEGGVAPCPPVVPALAARAGTGTAAENAAVGNSGDSVDDDDDVVDSDVPDGCAADVSRREESGGNWEFADAEMRASMSAVALWILSMCSRMFSSRPFLRRV